MSPREQIIIAGGSLAGMAAGIRLHQLGFDPLVLDRSHFPRVKLCGEFLGPDSFGPLQKLGVFDAVSALAPEPVRRVHFYNRQGKPLTIDMQWMDPKHPYALAIPRSDLDYCLLQAARQLGVRVLEGRRIMALEPDGEPHAFNESGDFLLDVMSSEDARQTYRTVCPIDATGRAGGLAMPSAKQKRQGRQVGIQCHVRLARELNGNDLRMYLFPGGYGGIQPVSGDIANVCMLAPGRAGRLLPKGYEALMGRTMGLNPAARALLRDSIQVGDFTTTANLNLNLEDDSLDMLRIGDALVTVDPFTGSGMAHALETGILAAECIASGLTANQSYLQICRLYQRQYRRSFGNRLNLLKQFRPVMHSAPLQGLLWPIAKPFLPALTRTFR